MTELVLDASAVLAWLRREAGEDTVQAVIHSSALCAVNLAEVVTKLIERGMAPERAVLTANRVPCEVAPFDKDLAVQTGLLRQATRALGLSLGDRACLALALREGLPVLTADRAWAELDVGVEIRMLR